MLGASPKTYASAAKSDSGVQESADMSTESAYYEVIENQRRIELARAEAWREAESLQARARSLADRAKEAGRKYGLEDAKFTHSVPRRPAESGGLGEIEAYVAALRAHCTAVEGELARAVVVAETRLLLTEIAKHTAGSVVPNDELFSLPSRNLAADRTPAMPLRSEGEVKLRDREVVGILGRLSGHVAPADRENLKRLAAEVLREGESGQARTLALDLRLRVQTANEKAEKATRDTERAVALRVTLRGLEGDDVTTVAVELSKVERQELPLTDVLVRRAEEVERTARGRANRAYAAEVIREELERLGYEVEEGFTSLFIKGGQAQLRKAGLEDYRVLMGAEPATDQLHVQLARFGRQGEAFSQQQELRDRETEEKWCQDFAHMRQALDRRRIATRVVRRVPAGAQPICVFDGVDAHIGRRREEPMAKRRT